MKRIFILTVVFLFLGGVFSANAQDIISLKDGSTIQAKVSEITPTEIKYKRYDNQNGPLITILSANVLSIKYPNGTVDVISTASTGATGASQQSSQTGGAQLSGALTAQLQNILNSLPAITIAGNSLKFQFNGDKWTALLNGDNFSTGIIETENTEKGSILTLKQTHIWPGAAAKTAGKVAGLIPGGAAVGGAVSTAGQVAGAAGLAAGAVEAAGKAIILEYIAGPSPKLSYLRTATVTGSSGAAGGNSSGEPIKLETVEFTPNTGSQHVIQYTINKENIEGSEREVLNINGRLSTDPWGNISTGAWLSTSDTTIVEKLINGSGIRFKVIGDGKNWHTSLIIKDIITEIDRYSTTITNIAYYTATIKTTKNKMIEVDIPYSQLKKSSGTTKFNNDNIVGLNFGMSSGFTNTSGTYSIKIFDIEIY